MTVHQEELDLLETLTCRVWLLTLGQAARAWWPGADPRRAERRIKLLANEGWIRRYVLNVPLVRLSRPLWRWRPSGQAPDPDRVAAAAKARFWAPSRPAQVLVAGPEAASLWGTAAWGLPPLEHRARLMRLAAVYLHYRSTDPQLAATWVGRQAFPTNQPIPVHADALVQPRAGAAAFAIRVAGRWDPARVERFHEACAQCQLAYELW